MTRQPAREKVDLDCVSEKSISDNVEKIGGIPAVDEDTVQHGSEGTRRAATTTTGDRPPIYMDLENGLVGWEDDNDPQHP